MVLKLIVNVRDKSLLKQRQPRYFIKYTRLGSKIQRSVNFRESEMFTSSLKDFIYELINDSKKFTKLRFARDYAELRSKEILPEIKKLKPSQSKTFNII